MDKKFYRQDAKEKEKSHSWRSLQLGGSLSIIRFGILA